jgi:hypothetical protein
MPEEFAPGLPDPRRFGSPKQLPIGKPLSYVIQEHLARRAGPHFDLRLGPDQGRKPTMMSWALRHLPKPGERRRAFQQPLHTGQYADFEGTIVKGYGAGTVKQHDRGTVLVTKAEPDKINFVVTHKKHPETFSLIRTKGAPPPKSRRAKMTQGGTWLLVNTTPTEVIEHKKVRYTPVSADKIEKLFDEDYLHSEKIDGAAALYHLLSDRIEVLSYRPQKKTGRPIVHTYRVGNTTGLNIPKHLVGSVLRGELYGVHKPTGTAIPPQELGGLLNASTLRSMQEQAENKVELRNALFNIYRVGKQPVAPDAPIEERMELLKDVLQHLPRHKFHLPEMAESPAEQREMWQNILEGKNPRTREGVVVHRKGGSGPPAKVKLTEERDVYVKDIFPGAKRLADVGAGGFSYALEPEGPIVGKVGTGFTEATRRKMLESPEEFTGRVARVKAQEQFPSGALRAPRFISLHEDYPVKTSNYSPRVSSALEKLAAVTKSARPNPAQPIEAVYYNNMLDAMKKSPAHAQRIHDVYTKSAPKFLRRAEESMLKRTARQAVRGPETLTGAGVGTAATAASIPAMSTAWHAGKAPITGLANMIRGVTPEIGARAAAAKSIRDAWKLKNIASGTKSLLGPSWMAFSGALEGAGMLGGARADPRYQRGDIGYGKALLGEAGRRGSVAREKAVKSFEGGVGGKLRGLLLSPFKALASPIATTVGFGQAAGRAGKRLLGLDKAQHESGPLSAMIKQSTAGAADDLMGFAKQALGRIEFQPGEESVDEWKKRMQLALQSDKTPPLRSRITSWATGMSPQELSDLRSGAKGLSGLVRKMRELKESIVDVTE